MFNWPQWGVGGTGVLTWVSVDGEPAQCRGRWRGLPGGLILFSHLRILDLRGETEILEVTLTQDCGLKLSAAPQRRGKGLI